MEKFGATRREMMWRLDNEELEALKMIFTERAKERAKETRLRQAEAESPRSRLPPPRRRRRMS